MLTTVRVPAEEAISPEDLEIANAYISLGSIPAVSQLLGVPADQVSKALSGRLCKQYIDNVYLDTGYRNRDKLGALLDGLITAKMEEMAEAEITTSADIVDLIRLAHTMRMDELKLRASMEKVHINNKTLNIQDNSLSGGNYGALLERLLS